MEKEGIEPNKKILTPTSIYNWLAENKKIDAQALQLDSIKPFNHFNRIDFYTPPSKRKQKCWKPPIPNYNKLLLFATEHSFTFFWKFTLWYWRQEKQYLSCYHRGCHFHSLPIRLSLTSKDRGGHLHTLFHCILRSVIYKQTIEHDIWCNKQQSIHSQNLSSKPYLPYQTGIPLRCWRTVTRHWNQIRISQALLSQL